MDLSEGQTCLDSHADTCVCGANFVMLERGDQVMEFVDVSPFSDVFKPTKDVPIASCATTWINPEDGQARLGFLQHATAREASELPACRGSHNPGTCLHVPVAQMR